MTSEVPNSLKTYLQPIRRRRRTAMLKAPLASRAKRRKFIFENMFENEIEAVAYPLCSGLNRVPNFETPKTFTEFARGLWLTHPNPLMSLVADKSAAQRYFEFCASPIKPCEQTAVYDAPEAVDLDALPERCVLKITSGCKMNLFHTPDNPITQKRFHKFVKTKWNRDHWHRHSELHYRDIPKRIVVEKLWRDPKDILEIGIYCCFGTPYRVAETRGEVISYGSPEGEASAFDGSDEPLATLGKIDPLALEAIIETARLLAEPLAHCRVDFFYHPEGIALGEITISPGAYLTTMRVPENEAKRLGLMEKDRLPDAVAEGTEIARKLGWPTKTSFGHFSGDPRLATGGRSV